MSGNINEKRMSVHVEGKDKYFGYECPLLQREIVTEKVYQWLRTLQHRNWTALFPDGTVAEVEQSWQERRVSSDMRGSLSGEFVAPPERIVLLVPYCYEDASINRYCFESEQGPFRQKMISESEERHKKLIKVLEQHDGKIQIPRASY